VTVVIDVEAQLAEVFGVQSFPTVMAVARRRATSFVGALPETEIRRFVEHCLAVMSM
jgi:thioredoxin-like negative regulator of GroEL